MPVEIKGNTVRIRIREPYLFDKNSYKTDDLQEKGKLQRVTAQLKKSGEWATQSFVVNVRGYSNFGEIVNDINSIKEATPAQKVKAISLARKLFRR